MPKFYTGQNIREVINQNAHKWTTAETEQYIIIYPAPALYLRPLNSKAVIFTKQLTATPANYPGGCYKAKQYTITPDRNTLPEKYKNILRESAH